MTLRHKLAKLQGIRGGNGPDGPTVIFLALEPTVKRWPSCKLAATRCHETTAKPKPPSSRVQATIRPCGFSCQTIKGLEPGMFRGNPR